MTLLRGNLMVSTSGPHGFLLLFLRWLACVSLKTAASDLSVECRMTRRRVVVTGLGLQTPLGVGAASSWSALLAGNSGIRALTPADVASPLTTPETAARVLEQLPSKIAGLVPRAAAENAAAAPSGESCTSGAPWRGDAGSLAAEQALASSKGESWDASSHLDPHERGLPRFIQLALLAAKEALTDAQWHPKDVRARQQTGVAIGGGIGPVHEISAAGQLVDSLRLRRLTPHFVPRVLINMPAGHVSIKYGFQGPNHAVATACASGAHSLGDAFRIIRDGDADVMVAGGSESCIDALSMGGFSRIAEGAGMVVLEELSHALARGAPRLYAELRGYGMSGDAFHITQPSPEGTGAALAMERALRKAQLRASDIGYLNAHATSTPIGDAIEASAIAAVLGLDHVANPEAFAMSSTKGATGHLLGAAGAVEAVFTILALHHGIAPPNLNLEAPDDVFAGGFAPIAETRQVAGMRAAMSNSFGFGGTNASLIFTGLDV